MVNKLYPSKTIKADIFMDYTDANCAVAYAPAPPMAYSYDTIVGYW